jgi:SAM-dependent methyltransferase
MSKKSLWRRLSRFRFYKKKISTKNIDKLCGETATDKLALVVHSEDVDYKPYFPNAYTVTKRKKIPADMHVDNFYKDLKKIPDGSYEVILCTGLLEHIPDPQRIIDDFYRILKPGGELIIGASAVFSFHEGPHDYFRFTPFSFELFFKKWSHIKMMRGSCQPFETIAILLQRILIQCEIYPPLRPIIEFFVWLFPFFDKAISVQYRRVNSWEEEDITDSMLPSNMHAVVVK